MFKFSILIFACLVIQACATSNRIPASTNPNEQRETVENKSLVNLSDFERQFVLLPQKQAVWHCEEKGAHLPSARELAMYAMSRGAKGISNKKLDDSYYLEDTMGADGKPDKFFYSAKGYSPPSDDIDKVPPTWSSSQVANDPGLAVIFQHFRGQFGHAGDGSPEHGGQYWPIRCATDAH